MPASRVTDMHICPMVTPGVPPIPHVGGPVLPPGGITVLIGMLPAARLGDMCVCVGPPDVIVMGSMTVITMNQPQARIMDPTAHGGMLMLGEMTVIVGDAGLPPPPMIPIISVPGMPAIPPLPKIPAPPVPPLQCL